jgi:hypothetical protein
MTRLDGAARKRQVTKTMAKSTSTNTTFFKTNGRLAASHDPTNKGTEYAATGNAAGAEQQGKEGQPNFIPGEAPVGQRGARLRKKK